MSDASAECLKADTEKAGRCFAHRLLSFMAWNEKNKKMKKTR